MGSFILCLSASKPSYDLLDKPVFRVLAGLMGLHFASYTENWHVLKFSIRFYQCGDLRNPKWCLNFHFYSDLINNSFYAVYLIYSNVFYSIWSDNEMEKTRKNLTSVTPASTILTFASFSSSSFWWTDTREESESEEIIVFVSLNRDNHGRVSCLLYIKLTLTKLTCYISHICCSDVLSVRTDLKRHSWTNNTIQIHKHMLVSKNKKYTLS